MTATRVALGLVLLVVAASIGVGATTSSTAGSSHAPGAQAGQPPMGENVTAFMQANAAQAQGSVENGMWVAAFARADNASAKRQLVEARMGALNRSLAELQAERRSLQDAYRNGTINRTTYRARLSALVGQLAAFDDGVEEAGDRGRSVGVNVTRLEALRTQASELSGPEVRALARNLTGGPARGLFAEDGPGQSGDAGNRSDGPSDGRPHDGPGQGPPEDPGPSGPPSEPTETPTATDTS